MIPRIINAYSKFLFCCLVSADLKTLFKLLYNTKRLRWHKKNNIGVEISETAIAYNLKIGVEKYLIFLRTFQGDIDIFYEIFWKKIYKVNEHQKQSCTTIVDIGANVGMAALYFAIEYKSAQIICIEPDENNYALLQKNCSSFSNIKTLCAAVFEKDGWGLVKKAFLQYNNTVIFSDSKNLGVQSITMQSMMRIFNLNYIDLLKIDVEGAEEAIFSANTVWLDKVSQVLVEIHGSSKDGICFTALRQHQFSFFPLNPNGDFESVYFAIK